MHGAVTAHEAIQVNIVQRAHDDMQRMAIQRVGESRKLPPSQVCRQKQHSLAAGQGALEILEPVVDHDSSNVLQRVLREKTNFRQLPAQRSEHTAQNPGTLSPRLFRKCQSKIPHPDAPQAYVKQINCPGESNGCRARQWPGQPTQDFDNQPRKRVLKSLTHVRKKSQRSEVRISKSKPTP